MPKGYVIFTEDIHDEAGINAYVQEAIPVILQAGGQVLVADDASELIEGSWQPNGDTHCSAGSMARSGGMSQPAPAVDQRV